MVVFEVGTSQTLASRLYSVFYSNGKTHFYAPSARAIPYGRSTTMGAMEFIFIAIFSNLVALLMGSAEAWAVLVLSRKLGIQRETGLAASILVGLGLLATGNQMGAWWVYAIGCLLASPIVVLCYGAFLGLLWLSGRWCIGLARNQLNARDSEHRP